MSLFGVIIDAEAIKTILLIIYFRKIRSFTIYKWYIIAPLDVKSWYYVRDYLGYIWNMINHQLMFSN